MAVSNKDQRPIRPVETPGAPETPETRPGIDQLREIYEQARELVERQRRGFLAAAGATGFVLLAAILLQTPLYESSSLLLVKFGRELVYKAEVGSEQAFVPRDKESVINSELAIARSRPVLGGALRQVGIAAVYPDLGEALEEIRGPDGEITSTDDEALIYAEGVERVGGVLTAQALPEADVLSLAFPHSDPHVAAKFVNALVDSFLEAHLTAFGEPRAVSFLSERVEEYQQRLDASETAMLEFESEHAAFALESPQSALVQWRDAAEAELTTIDSQMAAIRLRHLQEDTTVAEARNQLLQLEREAAALQGELLRETQKQIAVVRRFIGQRRYAMGGELAALEEKKAAV